MLLGPALPLGQLGQGLRPPSGRGPKFWKKKKVSVETPKNLIHPCDQKTKNLEHPRKHWYPKKFFGPYKINYPKKKKNHS